MRAGADSVTLDDRCTEEELLALRPAIRDLSLALCAAFEHMHEQVEADYLGKRYPVRDPAWKGDITVSANSFPTFADWTPAQPPSFARTSLAIESKRATSTRRRSKSA